MKRKLWTVIFVAIVFMVLWGIAYVSAVDMLPDVPETVTRGTR